MFHCSRCLHVNTLPEQFCCERCGNAAIIQATVMENIEIHYFEKINVGSNEREEIGVTENEAIADSNFQSDLKDVPSLEYLPENNFSDSLEGSSLKSETTSYASHESNRLFNTERPMELSGSPQAGLEDFEMSSGYRNQTALKDVTRILDEERIMRENYHHPIKSKSEMYATTFQDISNEGEQSAMLYDETIKNNAAGPINIVYSHLPSTIRELSRKTSDTVSSTEQAARSLDDSPVIPGPSGIQRNVNPKNLLVENSNYTYSRKFCNKCRKIYIQEHLHENECKCILCDKIFQCRTLYNEHLLEHKDFVGRCWICTRHLCDHLDEDTKKKVYKCCVCNWKNTLFNLIYHNNMHKPENFCRKCRQEYTETEKEFHGSLFACNMCPEKFECKIRLEEHYDNHDFKKYCIFCNKEKSEHKFVRDKKPYQCCKCTLSFNGLPSLNNHLESHSQLLLYKCKKCGERFLSKSGLSNHSNKCVPLHKCEICRLKFSSEDSLHRHFIAKHTNPEKDCPE